MGDIPVNNQNEADENKRIIRKDTWFACSMLVIYAICFILFAGGSYFWIRDNRKATYANATATQAAVVTQQANATATAVAHSTEQAQYNVIDKFDANDNRWLTGVSDNKYWKGSRYIADGTYTWNVETVKETFVSWANYSTTERLTDFDAYVDTKIINEQSGDLCSGFIFRKIKRGYDGNDYYYFALCNNSLAKISFHGKNEGWEQIATISSYSFPNDWNRLEINARGAHFTFNINGIQFFEMSDDRLAFGGLALVVELGEKVPAQILFDNFGLQRR